MLGGFNVENIRIYGMIGLTIIVTVCVCCALTYLSFHPIRKAHRRKFWIVAEPRGDGSGKRDYRAYDFYSKTKPTRYREIPFLSVFDAFALAKRRQDEGDYDVLFMTASEADERMKSLGRSRSGKERR